MVRCHMISGTLRWLSPEQLVGGGGGGGGEEGGQKADVWSLGCVLLELATCGYMDVGVDTIYSNYITFVTIFINYLCYYFYPLCHAPLKLIKLHLVQLIRHTVMQSNNEVKVC